MILPSISWGEYRIFAALLIFWGCCGGTIATNTIEANTGASQPEGTTKVFKDPCASHPCYNDATCIDVGLDKYVCICGPGFTGRQCQNQIPQCGHSKICPPSGPKTDKCCPRGTIVQCVDMYGTNYYCDCPPGFYLPDVNGSCVIAPNVFTVQFLIDGQFDDDYSDSTSQDYTNYALSITSNLTAALKGKQIYSVRVASLQGMGSLFIKGFYANVIITGQPGSSATSTLTVIQEYLQVCSSVKPYCFNDHNATIVADSFKTAAPCAYICPGATKCTTVSATAPASYACRCRTGFVATGTNYYISPQIRIDSCDDVNECLLNPTICGKGNNCTNVASSYLCSCKTGFTFSYHNSSCVQTSSCDPNPCRHGGSCSFSGKSDYICKCHGFYTGETCDSSTPLLLLCLCVIFGVLMLLLVCGFVPCCILETKSRLSKKATVPDPALDSHAPQVYEAQQENFFGAITYTMPEDPAKGAPQEGLPTLFNDPYSMANYTLVSPRRNTRSVDYQRRRRKNRKRRHHETARAQSVTESYDKRNRSNRNRIRHSNRNYLKGRRRLKIVLPTYKIVNSPAIASRNDGQNRFAADNNLDNGISHSSGYQSGSQDRNTSIYQSLVDGSMTTNIKIPRVTLDGR